jgi:IS5 family transposase
MLRSTYDQLSIWEPSRENLDLDEAEFEAALREHLTDVVSLDDFADFYHSSEGPSSCCPLVMAGMMMLQFRYGLSDRQVIKRCRRDLAWKHALRLGFDESPPARTTYRDFVAKVRKHLGDDFIHVRVLELVKRLELLADKDLQAADSTNTDCHGAVLDTFNLIARSIASVVRDAACCMEQPADELAEQFGMSQYLVRSVKGSVEIDWTDEAARNDFLTQEIRDADILVEVFGDPEVAEQLASSELKAAVELLAKVAHQDVEQLDDGTYRIARGTAKGRVISITDPEARHGRKSASKKINGHKTHVMGTVDSQFVTAIYVTDASVHDATPTTELIQQAEANDVKPREVLSDLAYGTGANRRECAEQGVTLRTKVPSANSKDNIPKQDFDIDLDAERVTCPAGKSTTQFTMVKAKSESDERVRQFRFDKADCSGCPLASGCSADTKKGKGRTIKLSVYEPEFQQAKSFALSPEGTALLRKRSAVERLISHLVRMGMRVARYFSVAKTQFQAFMTAAAYNFQRMATLMAKQRRQRA